MSKRADKQANVSAIARTLLQELEEKGYDRDRTWRYAKAAKSWCERGSRDWEAWDQVIMMTAPAVEE